MPMGVSVFILASFVLGIPLTAQDQASQPAQTTISPAEIFEKYLAATGGMEAHRSLQTLVIGGTVTYGSNNPDHPLGYYTYSYKAPLSDVLELDVIGRGISWIGHRMGEPFRRTGNGRAIEGISMDFVERDLYSLLEWDFSRAYKDIEVTGRTRVGHKWTYAVEFTTAQGGRLVRYYDTETFLLLRMDQVEQVENSKNQPEEYPIESYFSDYRNYGELKLPQVIAVHREPRDLIIRIEKVKRNPLIADSVFR